MSKTLRTNIGDAFERLATLIRVIRSRMNGPASPEATFRQLFISRIALGTTVLTADETEAFNDCVTDIYELVVAKKEHVSLSATEALIQSAMLQVIDENNSSIGPELDQRLTTSITQLRTVLSKPPSKWTVYHEIRGLMPNGLPRNVGDIEFFLIDDAQAAAFVSSAHPIVDGMLNTAEEREEFKISIAELIDKRMKGRTFAKIVVDAQEHEAASLLATKKLRTAVDLINFFADVYGQARLYLFLPGDSEPTYQVSIMFQESSEAHIETTRKGPLGPLNLSYINEDRARRSGFDRASSLFAKQNRNSFEERILTSLQWAGRAVVETRREEAFLLFVIALESLLLKKDQTTEMRFRFALKGAHLLVKKFEVRKRIFEDLRDAYDKRSQIVHSGSTQIAITELNRIHTLARDAFLTVLVNQPFRNMDSEDQFEDWLNNQTLGLEGAESSE